ncbi:MAG: hypothetical protein ACLTCJ_09720 [Gemmiger formicilis]|uniref:hypothetical protein n=1 Tax=Gemmiger formicilis TaxID=745368 RepID=UPI003A38F1B0
MPDRPAADQRRRQRKLCHTVEETGHDAPAGLLYLGTQAAVNGDNEQTGTSLADIT